MHAYIGCLVLLGLSCSASTAWARATADVTGVSAELDLRDLARARVELELRLVVRSGKLASFELAGLDSDFEQVEVRVPAAIGAPVISREGPDRLRLSWADPRAAPARGEHTLGVRYWSQQLASGPERSGMRRVTWTLPRWRERLGGVQVRVRGPHGLRPIPPAEPALGETVAFEGTPPRLTFRRAELPRTEVWRVRLEVPAPTSRPEPPRHARFEAAHLLEALVPRVWPALLGMCLGALVVAKRRVRRRDAPEAALLPPLEAPPLDALAFLLCVLSAALLQEAPGLALACAISGVASGLERRDARQLPSGRATGEPPAARAPDLAAIFDATRPLGATLLVGLYAASLAAPSPERSAALTCVWLATPLFFSRTRLHERRVKPLFFADPRPPSRDL